MASLRRMMLALLFALAPGWVVADMVNINTADADTLAASLNGVGLAKASAIVAYRQQHGRFQSVNDLSLVKGIGPVIVDKNRESLSLGTDSQTSK